MEATTNVPELAEPQMLGLLTQLGFVVEYERAEGDTLYFRDADGDEVPVLDFAGGYGALILGHNPPEIVEAAHEFLAAGRPVLAQASRQSDPTAVAALLSHIADRELGGSGPYFAIFANSGAEGVEVAMKHAELDRMTRVGELAAEINRNVEQAIATARSGAATVEAAALRRFGLESSGDAGADAAAVGARVRAELEAAGARPALYLTFAGSFHGKLAGSVQLTHNPAFRLPYAAMAAQARFVPFDQPGAVAKAIESDRVDVPDVVVEDGRLRVVDRLFPAFTAFVLEVIQGEGGIRVVSGAIADELRAACDAVGCPVVVDEIQSGMGRTGAFFATGHIGLRADYLVLAKGLGGGVAKAAVTLIRQEFYRPEFEFSHTSTFARDGFSTALALRTLRLLEADDGAAYRLAAAAGVRLRDALDRVRDAYPDVVADVRGRGLMLGFEFRDQSNSPLTALGQAAAGGMLGYLCSGYLLRAHRIRTFPTASAVNTLRLEPSIHLTADAIARLETALREVCVRLRDDPAALLA